LALALGSTVSMGLTPGDVISDSSLPGHDAGSNGGTWVNIYVAWYDTFEDLEPDMGSPKHLALHPFDRVPTLRHGDFMLYETSAIVAYIEELFPTPALQPDTPQGRARMNQWISAVNSYYYTYTRHRNE
jgi:hypothetical protein